MGRIIDISRNEDQTVKNKKLIYTERMFAFQVFGGVELKHFCFILILSAMPLMVQSQENQTLISGELVQAESGDPVPYAHLILEREGATRTATTDTAGMFEISNIPYGIYRLTISSIGYQTLRIQEIAIEHQNKEPMVIKLTPAITSLDEIVVRADPNITAAARLSGGYAMTAEEVRRFPATFYDPARMAAVYPGIININDQANNLAIRGNSPNQMNFYIHGAEIVNSNHLANAGTSTDRTTLSGGSVNMISAQLLEKSLIYTGVIPVDLAQATSGAMDFFLKRGSTDRIHFTGQAGLNGIDLALEGPIGDRWSFITNYRYSTVGLLSKMGIDFGGETILYQDLSMQLSFYQNERTTWRFFVMGGNNSNDFSAKADSLREEYKDLFDINFSSQIGIAGLNVETEFNERLVWKTTFAASNRWDERQDELTTVSSSLSSDYIELTKYALVSQFHHNINNRWGLRYGINTTAWSGGLKWNYNWPVESVNNFNTRSLVLRPFVHGSWKWGHWLINGALGASYNELSGELRPEPKLAITRSLPMQQNLSLNSGWQNKLQPYQVLLVSKADSELSMMQSWKSTLTYEKFFNTSTLKSTIYYEELSDVANDGGGFSALNILEEYPPVNLNNEGEGFNVGWEVAFQHYLNQGFFYILSGSLSDVRFRNPEFTTWVHSHYNNKVLLNGTIGKEFDFSDSEKQKTLGVNLQVIYSGGFWETPVDLTASRMEQRTIRSSEEIFSDQLPSVLKTNFRVYYKINHSKRYSLIGLDLTNVLNRQNVSYRYYDPFLDRIVDKTQLGLIPMLSYVLRI